MSNLKPGEAVEDEIKLLIQLTSITSESVKGALIARFCRKNISVKAAAAAHGFSGSNLYRAIERINAANQIVNQIIQIRSRKNA